MDNVEHPVPSTSSLTEKETASKRTRRLNRGKKKKGHSPMSLEEVPNVPRDVHNSTKKNKPGKNSVIIDLDGINDSQVDQKPTVKSKKILRPLSDRLANIRNLTMKNLPFKRFRKPRTSKNLNRSLSCSDIHKMDSYHRRKPTKLDKTNEPSPKNQKNFRTFVKNFNAIRKNLKLKTRCKSDRRNSLDGTDDDLVERFHNISISERNKPRKMKSFKKSKAEKKRDDGGRKKKQTRKGRTYPDYIDNDNISKGLKDGTYIKGSIRINPRNFMLSYVTSKSDPENDIFINSIMDRNRALEGDEVVLKVKPEEEWVEGRKCGVVVYISKMTAQRTAIGNLYPDPKNRSFAILYPRDKKFPLVQIPQISWPQGFAKDPPLFADNLFLVKITDWSNPRFARGLIIDNLGKSGDLRVETQAILKTWGLAWEPFQNDVSRYLPRVTEHLLDEWMKDREDLRDWCIFTIDPLTARDLDDAVSCRALTNGNYEVGVHIADVSFFLDEGTSLDLQVRERATTVYLVDNVYHMLPIELCLNCSLLPGRDKLAFSVIWELTPEGDIVSTRFARTVINSCVQLAYEHAQKIINGEPSEDFPEVHNGREREIKETVLRLHSISQHLRRKRFECGALQIGQIKLSFRLDPQTGLPTEFFVYEQTEAHRLIEEFMLLANMSVAKQLNDKFPDVAFLRLHEPPKTALLDGLQKLLETLGIHIDVASAKSLQNSLTKYATDDYYGSIRMAVLNHLLTKPMKRARYFCASVEPTQSYWHYALNVPLYTHFTSPIRRYADIVVHRLLAASVGLCQKPDWDPLEVAEIADNCNCQKYAAKRAGEDSSELYLHRYIEENQPYVTDAAVVTVREKSFDLLVLKTGAILKLNASKLGDVEVIPEEIPVSDKSPKSWRIRLIFPKVNGEPQDEIVLEMFIKVTVELRIDAGRMAAKILPPKAIIQQ